jgi:hypothetical protein
MTPARRRLGWLAAVSLLLHGWLPVVLGASLVAAHGGDRYAPDVPICAAAATSPRPAPGPVCPVSHDPICLCAVFASLLAPELGPAPAPPLAIRDARRRSRTRSPASSRPVALFEARAPPHSG